MKKIMFICTANSCRSQMAEGFAREFGKDVIEVHSAGLMAAGVHRRAAAVMKEVGIDISAQESKEIDTDILKQMDLVVTLCDNAERVCSYIPFDLNRVYIPIDDPVGTAGSEEIVMNDFRRARDEIKAAVLKLIEDMGRSEQR
ncbi:MAG: arsenate reductase ArsC [Nitrospirota bacterium]